MAALNFPTSPALNQVFTANGKSWRWDGIAWKSFNTISISGGGTGLTSITAGNAFLSSNSAGIALTYRTFTAGTGMEITVSANDVTFAATGVSSGTVTGTGTSGYVPLWTSAGVALTDSIMSQISNTVVVSGSIKALTKSFIIPHPIYPETKKLEHGSLEGPEHGAYQRGTGKGLEKVEIKLPDYWSYLVEKDYTVLLTPKCNHNLYVASQNPDSFTVRRIGSNIFSKKYIEFDYFLIGERKDIKIITEQDR